MRRILVFLLLALTFAAGAKAQGVQIGIYDETMTAGRWSQYFSCLVHGWQWKPESSSEWAQYTCMGPRVAEVTAANVPDRILSFWRGQNASRKDCVDVISDDTGWTLSKVDRPDLTPGTYGWSAREGQITPTYIRLVRRIGVTGCTNFWHSAYMVIPLAQESSCTAVKDPVLPATGVQAERQVDYTGAGADPLSLTRYYRSQWPGNTTSGFGGFWSHNYSGTVRAIGGDGSGGEVALVMRPQGQTILFRRSGGGTWTPSISTHDALTGDAAAGFTYLDSSTGNSEQYDVQGRLIFVKNRVSQVTQLTYGTSGAENGKLTTVRNAFGRTLTFQYDAKGRIAQVSTPNTAAQPIRYQYEEAANLASGMAGNNQLTSITWQDGTSRKYHYENAGMLHGLTGITDEKGVRVATFAYGADGRVVHGEEAGGTGAFDVTYPNGSTTRITETVKGNATSTDFSFTSVGSTVLPAGQSAPCPGCGANGKSSEYDALGNLTRRIGHGGSDTRFTYDTLNRQIRRDKTVGAGPTQTVLTEWHPTWNVPVRAATPGMIQTFEYDAVGRLVTQTETPTSDLTGAQGFSAPSAGPSSSTHWVYDPNGLILSAEERAADGTVATWQMTYDAQGNLATYTNPNGQKATVTSYDAEGRLLEGIDTAGRPIKLTYSPRGFVTDLTIGGDTTHYERDVAGSLVSVSMAGSPLMQFTYDATNSLVQALAYVTIDESATSQVVASEASPFRQSSTSGVRAKAVSFWNRTVAWLRSILTSWIAPAHAQMAGGGGAATTITYPVPAHQGSGLLFGNPSQPPEAVVDSSYSRRPRMPGEVFIEGLIRSCVDIVSNITTVLSRTTDAQECANECEAQHKTDVKMCETWWKTTGRNADAYRECMTRATRWYTQCHHDCGRLYE